MPSARGEPDVVLCQPVESPLAVLHAPLDQTHQETVLDQFGVAVDLLPELAVLADHVLEPAFELPVPPERGEHCVLNELQLVLAPFGAAVESAGQVVHQTPDGQVVPVRHQIGRRQADEKAGTRNAQREVAHSTEFRQEHPSRDHRNQLKSERGGAGIGRDLPGLEDDSFIPLSRHTGQIRVRFRRRGVQEDRAVPVHEGRIPFSGHLLEGAPYPARIEERHQNGRRIVEVVHGDRLDDGYGLAAPIDAGIGSRGKDGRVAVEGAQVGVPLRTGRVLPQVDQLECEGRIVHRRRRDQRSSGIIPRDGPGP